VGRDLGQRSADAHDEYRAIGHGRFATDEQVQGGKAGHRDDNSHTEQSKDDGESTARHDTASNPSISRSRDGPVAGAQSPEPNSLDNLAIVAVSASSRNNPRQIVRG